MTISSETNKITYNGNGVTNTFAYTFKILDQGDILVRNINSTTGVITTLIITTDYTVTGVGADAGGNVVLVDPATDAASGTKIVLTRNLHITQGTDYTEYDSFPATSHETALDRLTMIAQQQDEQVSRSLKLDPVISGVESQIVGTPAAGNVPVVNSGATGFQWSAVLDIGSFAFPVGNGMLAQTASGVGAARTNTGTANEITVTNGDGVSGNPTYSLPTALTFTGKTVTGGTFAPATVAMSSYFNEAKGADIASAGTTDIGAATGNYLDVTGTTTITALGTIQAGTRRIVRFTGSLTLTHNATSLILPTGGNIQTTAGDVATFVSLGSGNWRCTNYTSRDNTIILSDVTTNNVSTSAHGFMVKVPGTNTVWLGSGSGSYGQVPLTTHVTGTLPVANGGTGVTSSNPVIQRVSTQTGAVATGTTAIPVDDTIPQNTEGDQYMTLSITPKNTNNILVIDVEAQVASSVLGNSMALALFQDSTANALAVAAQSQYVANQFLRIKLRHTMTAGTTSSTTFNIRIGGSTGATTTFNGSGGARFYGGVFASSITITEYAS